MSTKAEKINALISAKSAFDYAKSSFENAELEMLAAEREIMMDDELFAILEKTGVITVDDKFVYVGDNEIRIEERAKVPYVWQLDKGEE